MKNVVIFASGSGTNADHLIGFFKSHPSIRIAAVYTNKKDAGVIEVAKKHNTPIFHFTRELFLDPKFMLDNLREFKTDLIVLAGFLWKIPDFLIEAYPNQIINLHPSLLPKHGGKGMYGIKVHQSVIDAGEVKSGITIHYVNEAYDEGKIIVQATCVVHPNDTAEDLAKRIHILEYEHLPKVVDQLLTK